MTAAPAKTTTARKTATKKTTADAKPVAAKSRWATIRDQARKEHARKDPYVFDDTVVPPIVITAPDTVDRVTALAALMDMAKNDDGTIRTDIDPKNVVPMFRAICGEAFPRVWSVISKEPVSVLWPLFWDINDHFGAVPGDDGDYLPGGESAS
ncbi:hypothetical protein [Prescottella agglutinans]|uniref:Tail assembly chaperone n=1 Tax=Prescottella agglutinans TaxID=1644129 RepID=A0ABT6MFN5_9NOCA|nr:hypothetical protein [Prescottella agglutinans]MDH6283123.1 hypothetical protein [Prescottella agglutinans]